MGDEIDAQEEAQRLLDKIEALAHHATEGAAAAMASSPGVVAAARRLCSDQIVLTECAAPSARARQLRLALHLLEAASEQPAGPAHSENERPMAWPGSPPILLVDDSPVVLHILQNALRSEGVANPIETCADVDQAISRLRASAGGGGSEDPPVLVITDVNMPGGSGIDILAFIRGASSPLRDAAVVVLTGESLDGGDVERAKALRADSFLVKPVAFDAIRDVVREIDVPRILLPRVG